MHYTIHTAITNMIQKHEISEKVSSVLRNLSVLNWNSRACQCRGFHMHQLWFSSWTLHLCFQKHCLFTASQSIITTDFPKKWVSRRSPNKQRCRGRKQPLRVSAVNKTIIAVIIMGFSISTFLISGYRNLFPAKQKSLCEVKSSGKTTFTTLRRLERFFHTKLGNQCVGKSFRNSNVLAKLEKGQLETTAIKSIVKSHLAEMQCEKGRLVVIIPTTAKCRFT